MPAQPEPEVYGLRRMLRLIQYRAEELAGCYSQPNSQLALGGFRRGEEALVVDMDKHVKMMRGFCWFHWDVEDMENWIPEFAEVIKLVRQIRLAVHCLEYNMPLCYVNLPAGSGVRAYAPQ